MKILKNMAIKTVAKKHSKHILQLVAQEIRENSPSIQSIEELDKYISKTLSGLGSKVGLIDRIKILDEDFDDLNGQEKMFRVVFELVRFELMYDLKFGTEDDFMTISKVLSDELSKWDLWEGA